jgi:hypothetical protein
MHVLTLAWFPAFAGIPGVDGFPAVAFILAVASVSDVAVFPAVDGVFAVAGFPAVPGVPMLLYLVSLRTVLYGLSIFSNCRNIEYWTGEFEKLSDYRISDQGQNLSDIELTKNYRLPTSANFPNQLHRD